MRLSTSHPLKIPAWALAQLRQRLPCICGRVTDCPGARAPADR